MILRNKPFPEYQTRLAWNDFSTLNWENYYSSIKKANLLQSSAYGRTCAKMNYQTLRQGIFIIDNQPAALLQILEAGFLNKSVHGVILDRGPLWFGGFGNEEEFALFLQAFRHEFPARFGRRIRFIPEIENKENIVNILTKNGFKKKGEPYKTIWLDIRSDLEALKANLDKKWRNALNKSQKQGLKIIEKQDPNLLAWFLSSYKHDKRERNYQGASLNLLTTLTREFSSGKKALTLYALFDETPIAAILIFIHGHSATYQIGYSSDLGRKKNAHNALLWYAIEILKERNICEIDLGGIIGENDGFSKFKRGMGGKTFETPGIFIG
ncbi:MAG: peptidoglycan bridge formation glycyltransferase FemA/FemB family protein [Alphaproteobacteria bacterium]|nr:peptidoglycan bridge formation glycyltransferase FemA/FemB family protein [Alphaproteobacteria bacterium]